jgi:hypothetical protein
MADAAPLDLQEKRRLLHGKGMERKQAAAAEALLREGRLGEACEYLEHNRDAALLRRVRREAVERGDPFGLARACALLREEASPEEWRGTADRARRDGRFYEAIRSLEKAGDAEAAEALRLETHPDYRPFRPAGK